jgi:uncharacterized protein (DUF362 family)
VREGSCVLVKPNVLCGLKAETGATVCPEIVEEIVFLSFQSGASRVYIAEASNWGIDPIEALRFCGYGQVAERTGAELVNLKTEEQITLKLDHPIHPEIRLPRIIFDSDVVINVPVLKTHNQTGVSVSLKNLAVGVCPDEEKQQKIHSIGLYQPLHEELVRRGSALDRMIVAVSKILPTHLVVVDGFYGMEGWGAPITGKPVGAGLVLAGTDRVAVDAVACHLIGMDPNDVPHIRLASEAGMGKLALADIELLGTPIDEAMTQFESSIITDLHSLLPGNVQVVCENACYSCISNFAYFVAEHRDVLEDLGPVTVVMGRADEIDSDCGRLLYYGNCAGANMYGGGFAPGCVPRSRRQVFEALGIGDRYTSYEWANTV